MSRELTTTSYAILGLLAIKPWTTYELAQQMDRSLKHYLPRAASRIYEEPKRLTALGLADATPERVGKRPRTVYSITAEGRETLAAWLAEPGGGPVVEFEAMLKVFFADAGSLDQLATTIDAIESGTVERIQDLVGVAESAEDSGFPERRHISALAIRLQYLQEAAVLTWTRWARAQIAEWRSTADAGTWDAAAAFAELATEARRILDGP